MIPVYDPVVGEEEIAEVVAALRRGEISGSFGESIKRFEGLFAAYCGSRHGIAVSSGTTALQLAVRAAGIGSGDEVLVSACTNVATALAAFHNQALPVAVDCELETWNMNPGLLDDLVTPRTKAIIPVHHLGHPVDMDQVNAVANRHGLIVIEDAAEAHGARWRGKCVGSFGRMSCFSFYANKVITTGEGGMILTDDDVLADKMRLLRNLAFTKPRFRHNEAGYNFRMTSYQAAMGVAQMAKIDSIIAAKRQLAELYSSHLQGIAEIERPREHRDAFHVYWMYGVVVREGSGLDRDKVLAGLEAKGVETRTFFCPMNQQPFLMSMPGFRPTPCPVADGLWRRGFYLPSSYTLDEERVAFIADALRSAIAEVPR